MDAPVLALAVDGDGNLYAGGEFTTAGGVVANHVARWDGASWSALGSGVDSNVHALAVDGDGNLYAGGNFATAGGVAANHVAKWDGASWSALGTGIGGDGDVRALAVDGSGNLYAGGYFWTAGGVRADSIARWDGASWSELGGGVWSWPSPYYDGVAALAADGGGNLYVGGHFGIAGGKLSSYIARWTAADGRAIAGPGSYTFYADNLPVTVVVPPGGQGNLARINIQRFDKSHSNAPAPLQMGYYWDIEGLKANGMFASGYSVDLTLPVPGFTPDENARMCRYLGSGMNWDCAMTSYTANTITRNGVTQLSDWAVSKTSFKITVLYLPLVLR